MANQAMLKKGSFNRIKSNITSNKQAKRLLNALLELNNNKLKDLEKRGKVKKLNVIGDENIYVFYMGLKERIIFSLNDNKFIIHDIGN